jgi:YD repeat-containing protein
VNYTYDYNGNTLTKVVGSNTTSYAWDYENRMTSVTLQGAPGAGFAPGAFDFSHSKLIQTPVYPQPRRVIPLHPNHLK